MIKSVQDPHLLKLRRAKKGGEKQVKLVKMKKNLPIIIVLLVVVALLAGWKFLGKGKNLSNQVENQTTETKKEEADQNESFTGKIKDAFMRNVPLKCTYKINDHSFGVAWLKNKKYYGEITVDDKTGYMIFADNCLWSWSGEQNQGAKMCFEPQDNEDPWDNIEKEQKNPDINYTCVPAVVDEAVFEPPKSIKFMDISQMMQDFQQPTQATGEEE